MMGARSVRHASSAPGYGLRFGDPPVLGLVPAESVAVFNCPVNGSCAGGPTTNCSTGYTGALCGACAENYGRRGNGTCVPCHGGTSYTQNLWQTLLVLGLFATVVAALNNKQRLASVFRLVLDAELLEHGKIVVGFFQ
eukprot:SAG22_NODE_1923_length_3307_cov_1.728803_1_plen_137_part_10